MKRRIALVEEEHEREHEESESSGDESEDVESRINGVLSHLSRAVPEKCASDLLHRMAASKDILFWTPRGQLLRNERIIPVKKTSPTIMDKSLGTVVQFERFLTHAKLYPRATNTVRPSPLPHPTDSVETVKAQFL